MKKKGSGNGLGWTRLGAKKKIADESIGSQCAVKDHSARGARLMWDSWEKKKLLSAGERGRTSSARREMQEYRIKKTRDRLQAQRPHAENGRSDTTILILCLLDGC